MGKSTSQQVIVKRDPSKVQVIGRAMSILRILKDTGGVTLSQLSREVGLAHSTTHRIVSTLREENLVSIDKETGHIELGLELLSLGAAVMDDTCSQLHPYLKDLSIEVEETVELAIHENGRMLLIDQVPKTHRLEAVSKAGATFPLHSTANGKAFLAEISNDQVKNLLPEHLDIFTPNTTQTRKKLLEELDEIRAAGYAIDRGENTIGVYAVGVGVQVYRGRNVYISIPVPSVRFIGNENKIISALLQTRNEINLNIS